MMQENLDFESELELVKDYSSETYNLYRMTKDYKERLKFWRELVGLDKIIKERIGGYNK